jgi:PAS domain S-box-containing protein
MSWSQPQQIEGSHDQMSILVGSAIQLLRGECGVFVVSNEAFDPQSSSEYTLYKLDKAALPLLLTYTQEGMQPNSLHPLVVETLAPEVALELGLSAEIVAQHGVEYGSLALHDDDGLVGVLHFLRAATRRSCFERYRESRSGNPGDLSKDVEGEKKRSSENALHLFVAQLSASLRFALRSQALVKEQRRLAAIFRNSTDGILTVDNALRIIDFNPAMERLTGWRESEVLGQFYVKVLRPKDRQGNDLGLQDSPILQAFAGQEVVNREMIISARDGQLFTVSITASCVRSLRGEPMNGILNVRDLTRERQQEEQRSTFISVISHELQTPIAIIKGYASTLARADARFDPTILRTRLVAIEEEADRLNQLVGNLLYASRIQANGLQMDIAALDLEYLIYSVVRRLRTRSPEVDISMTFAEPLPMVMADRERIEEVLQNLLDNAIKYSPGHPKIVIACNVTSEEVIVSVKDNGMGIALREQEQIFDRFHRVGDPLAQTTPGAGLGLYICKAIVEAHGGRIWVESTLRHGSTFFFSLPREEKAQLPMVVF